MIKVILALNAGSSSIKFALYRAENNGGRMLVARGTMEDSGAKPHFSVKDPDGKTLEERGWAAGANHEDLLAGLLDWISRHLDGAKLDAAGHRIVHGGSRFDGPVILDKTAIDAIDALTPLAPLHQPRCLEPVRALCKLQPGLMQVASFDTAFHRTIMPPASRYALPRKYEAAGIRKYGFHGLSYAFIARRLAAIDPKLASKRVVVAHLGSGASLCAMRDGRSLDTTMGFSVLDGLVMGTRPGALDPGIVLHLQRQHGLSLHAVEQLLYHQSGLLGVSGLSSDMRDLSGSGDPRAQEALDLFAFRVARETAALASTLGGLDAFVFTGGIGEHDAIVRVAVIERLAWLGATLDSELNEKHAETIGARGSRINILVVPTNEEEIIADDTVDLINHSAQKQ